MNGVKQGRVLSPILFAVYTGASLEQLENIGVCCHMGSRFAAPPPPPHKSALSIPISVC